MKQAQDRFTEMIKAIRGETAAAAQPDVTTPSIAGAKLLFDLRRDLPRAGRARAISKANSPLVVRGDRAWIGFLASDDEAAKVLIIVTLDLKTGTSVTRAAAQPGGNLGAYDGPVLLAATRSHLCVAESEGVQIIPLDRDDAPDFSRAVGLGPDEGFPALGRKKYPSLKNPFVPAVAAVGDDVYLAIVGPALSTFHKPYNYSALFRWRPGAARVDKVAACDQLATGPFNDCAPYRVEEMRPGTADGELLLNIRTGPRLMTWGGGSTTWWRVRASNEWSRLERSPPAPAAPTWRVTTASDGKSFSLERRVNDATKVCQTFAATDFSPGELIETAAGLLWVAYRERPLIYLLPRAALIMTDAVP